MEAHAPVTDGVLVGRSVSMGNLDYRSGGAMPDGKYFGSIRAPRPVHDRVLEFLKRNHGLKLREVMDAEIDISDVIQ
jgi:hypothetical protein